ncbi:MFS transporter [Amycolatopsis acidiphila]|uniref:MFS transporter n=1 Tax=Amycolatopsis acidiphila TaxID=715473 RepID=A0A558A8L3_9PSEU|nr:MFS transporter [Amycolatopsis acidiphila]TVT20599.1 MFS transporter [Amycolatopsis acidiphila]UIJ61407.1 MFS transporter [Amycolatopsis acidiphila]GHG77850.1 MFS transporter [Amycolatopsis acidiphila]
MIVAERERGVLWTAAHRTTTVASLLVVTLIAFENMGVATAMPTLVAALGGQSLYSWPFTAFLVASVVATVLSGRLCDRCGPAFALIAGPAIFLAGLVLCGSARNMAMLLGGRVLQGLGSGTVLVAVSLLIALVYTDRERPVMYAANAAAWILPAVVGPSVAGLVTERFGWRWVFLGLVPLAVLGLVLLLPVARRLGPPEPVERQRRATTVAALAAAVGVAALTWAAQHPSPLALGYGAGGLVALGAALRKLLPPGTVTARPGLPTVVAARALLGGAFAGMEAYLPLTMTEVHGYHPAAAGLPLTVSALGWSAASALQGRHPGWSREAALRIGFGLVAGSLVLFAFVSQPWFPGWAAFVACVVGGAGMGTGYPAITVLLFRFSPVAERGFNTSAMQLGDWVGSALTVGLGGVLLGLLASARAPSNAVVVLATVLAGLALLGVLITRRWPTRE